MRVFDRFKLYGNKKRTLRIISLVYWLCWMEALWTNWNRDPVHEIDNLNVPHTYKVCFPEEYPGMWHTLFSTQHPNPSRNWGYVICLVCCLNYLAVRPTGRLAKNQSRPFETGHSCASASPCVCVSLEVNVLAVFMQLHKFCVTISIWIFFYSNYTFKSIRTQHTWARL